MTAAPKLQGFLNIAAGQPPDRRPLRGGPDIMVPGPFPRRGMDAAPPRQAPPPMGGGAA